METGGTMATSAHNAIIYWSFVIYLLQFNIILYAVNIKNRIYWYCFSHCQGGLHTSTQQLHLRCIS
ncbi:hypothetical protein BD408DRAFT_421699 [Parasitella parasitica]|nr:hypothetical protein BD408DRAFT_421699 [Parasitella parasitica]